MARHTGFTLIELLVVIGIIVILAAILFPAFASAREKARQVTCMSNVRQMALAVTMYVDDWDAYPFRHLRTPDGTSIRWWNLLQLYQQAPDLFVCPSVPTWEPGRNMAYGYNYQYLGNSVPVERGGNCPVAASDIQVPGKTIAVLDSDGTGTKAYQPSPSTDPDCLGNHGYCVDPPVLPPRPGNTFAVPDHPSRPSARHHGGSNVAFCDGHAKWYLREALLVDNTLWNGRAEPQP